MSSLCLTSLGLNHLMEPTIKDGQEKVMSILDVTGYAFAITDPKPEKKDLQNWENANKICRHIILSTLSNALFDVYCPYKTTTRIWESLNKKYILEDAGTQKFAIENFLNFVMSDEKDIFSQIHEYHVLIDDLKNENISLPEAFVVGALIENYPTPEKITRKN